MNQQGKKSKNRPGGNVVLYNDNSLSGDLGDMFLSIGEPGRRVATFIGMAILSAARGSPVVPRAGPTNPGNTAAAGTSRAAENRGAPTPSQRDPRSVGSHPGTSGNAQHHAESDAQESGQ